VSKPQSVRGPGNPACTRFIRFGERRTTSIALALRP
jgi:hypothetical protein